MNNALCGDPKELPGGDIGHSAFPDAVWAERVRVRPTPTTYVQAGVYEVNQGLYSDANFRSGFKFDASQDSGVYLPVEAAYEPLVGTSRMPGHYKLGFGYDTSPVYSGFASQPGVQPQRRTGNTQACATPFAGSIRRRSNPLLRSPVGNGCSPRRCPLRSHHSAARIIGITTGLHQIGSRPLSAADQVSSEAGRAANRTRPACPARFRLRLAAPGPRD